MNKADRRDTNVELLRIIACAMVICLHIRLEAYDASGQLFTGRLLISSLMGQAVTIFFLIMGFFVYGNKSFKKTLKKVFVSILVPFVLYLILEPVFLSYCLSEKSIFECLRDFNISGANIFQMFVWNCNNISYGGHLWYIFVYMEVILFLPLVKNLCADERRIVKIRRYFIGLGIAAKFLEDVQKVLRVEYGVMRLFNPLGMPIVITLIGYEIYQKKELLKNNWRYRIKGLAVYVAGSLLSALWQEYACYKGITEGILSYNSVISIISAVGFVVFLLSFTIKKNFIKSAINFVAARTYWIYLIHMLVITKLYTSGVRAVIVAVTIEKYPGFIGESLYILFYGATVFLVSFILTALLRGVLTGTQKVFHTLWRRCGGFTTKIEEGANPKATGKKWTIRLGVVIVVLAVETFFYQCFYVESVIKNSNLRHVGEVSEYETEDVDYVSSHEIEQEVSVTSRHGLGGIGVRVFYADDVERNTVIQMNVLDRESGELLISDSKQLSELNNGDYWQCHFEQDRPSFDGIVKLSVDGDSENVMFQCLKWDGSMPPMVSDGEKTDQILYLTRNESMKFIKKASDIYYVFCMVITLAVLAGMFMEKDREGQLHES